MLIAISVLILLPQDQDKQALFGDYETFPFAVISGGSEDIIAILFVSGHKECVAYFCCLFTKSKIVLQTMKVPPCIASLLRKAILS